MAHHTIHVPCDRPYEVLIGTRLLEETGALVRATCGGARAVIVTDSNVGPLYAHIVRQSLADAGYRASVFTFEAGEERKRAATYVSVLEFMAESELTRSDVVVALGGGVTGDLAGFAAATYMRGVQLVQMPTSLLAMVDSSVGGKTAIDLAAGKNLAGAFWQPALVIADVGCLGTLTAEQVADGCGEVIKHGVIADESLFRQLEATPLALDLIMQQLSLAAAIIARNVEIKRDVVAADEREQGPRKLLNFGHSIGHAVEAAEAYRLGHGSCVAIGMVAMARASARQGWCAEAVPARIADLCRRHGLPTETARTVDELYAAALHDKKRSGATIDLVIPHAIGACSIERTPLEDFRSLIAAGIGHARPVTVPGFGVALEDSEDAADHAASSQAHEEARA